MNIKKLLIIACITLQSSTILYADQAAWNKAFLAFGGGTDPVAAANSIKPNSLTSINATKAAGSVNNTQEALALARFTSGQKNKFNSSYSDLDIQNAIIAAQNPQPGTTDQGQSQTSTSAQNGNTTSPQIGDNVGANWITAITAFGGSDAISKKSAQPSILNTISTSSAAYNDAQVIVQYLNGSPMNSTDATNLNTSLAAQDLKSQIEAAKLIYNLYAPGTYIPAA